MYTTMQMLNENSLAEDLDNPKYTLFVVDFSLLSSYLKNHIRSEDDCKSSQQITAVRLF